MTDVVTSAIKTSQNLIFHQLTDENGKGKPGRHYTAIYGGIHWPSADSPSYYCMLAEEYLGAMEGRVVRGKVCLLSEFESEIISLDSFFAKVTDDADRFYCQNVYAAMDETKYLDFVEAYRDFRIENSISLGDFRQAPFEREFTVGLAMVQEYYKNGLLDIPSDSIAYQQLKSFARHDLGDKPEERFPAIDAFRFALAAFRKNKPGPARRRRRRSRNAMVI